MTLLENLNWRYAVKKYSKKQVSDADLNTIIRAINLSASSLGMQPYRLFVVENKNLRNQLGEYSSNSQITEASHLLVFAAYENITAEVIENYVQLIADVRGTSSEDRNKLKNYIEAHMLNKTADENFIWSAKQAYIALGTGLIAAADLKIDATPMEGFDNQKFDELLGLKEKGLRSVVLLSLGYRDEENDGLANLKKVRTPKDEFAMKIV